MAETNTATLEKSVSEDERSEAFISVLNMHAKFYREFNEIHAGENRFDIPFSRERIDRYVYDLIKRVVKNFWQDGWKEKEFIDYYDRIKK